MNVWRPLIWCSTVAWLLQIGDCASAGDVQDRLAIARTAVEEYFTSLDSVKARGSWSFAISGRGLRELHSHRTAAPVEWEWLKQGEQQRLEYGSFIYADHTVSPWYRSFDGRFSWHGEYELADDNTYHVRRFVRHPGPLTLRERRDFDVWPTPARLLGTVLYATDETLLTRLHSSDAIYVGEEEVAAANCWRFDLGCYPVAPDRCVEMIAWIDPQRGYLPRQLSFAVPGADRVDHTIVVKKFFEADDCTSEVPRWFPRWGVVHAATGDETVDVLSAVANCPLTPDDFRPQLEPGTLIFDDKFGRETIVGAPAAHKRILGRWVSSAQETPPPLVAIAEPLMDARREPQLRWTEWLFYICCAALIGAALLRARSWLQLNH